MQFHLYSYCKAVGSRGVWETTTLTKTYTQNGLDHDWKTANGNGPDHSGGVGIEALVTYSSTYVLVALSVDRYDAIAHPMNFSTSCK
ncbi:hypothetical protein AVEN_99887-1 [Araneus ventricosus]|uniref:Uncharacterized protein n=1 Tax=Araneus ventricosus TaxID=182803 RepID=A0A4Y2Q980_ARAVE|nr:hypothetical protein AVEN_99887-1 [Araneus ventricosus]